MLYVFFLSDVQGLVQSLKVLKEVAGITFYDDKKKWQIMANNENVMNIEETMG
jgi:hypothetical protein